MSIPALTAPKTEKHIKEDFNTAVFTMHLLPMTAIQSGIKIDEWIKKPKIISVRVVNMSRTDELWASEEGGGDRTRDKEEWSGVLSEELQLEDGACFCAKLVCDSSTFKRITILGQRPAHGKVYDLKMK